MINIEQITSRLAKLPDQALQQYAMMHKEDPYIMSLAVSESNRRKQIRAAGQAQGAQEQPKVADQALMDMAPQPPMQSPDEVGIAALPAGEMNFADGGIVAFADGGDVERYQVGGSTHETPYDRMNRLNREREAAARAERLARIEAAGGNTTPYSEQMGKVGSFIDQYVPDPRDLFKTLVQAPGYEWFSKKDTPTPMPAPSAAGASSPQSQPTPQQIEAAARTKPRTEAGLGGTKEAAALRDVQAPGTTPASVGGPSIESAKAEAGKFLDTKAMRAELDKFTKDEDAAVAAQRAKRNEGKPTDKAFSKYEEMLQKEEAGAGKEKDEALGLAIFKAGLGMMSGSSPHAFENIGKGAMAGMEEYSGAIKDMKKATRERQKAFADIENARRAESRDDWKSAQDFEEKASTRLAKAREFGVKSIMDITGKDADIASKVYDRQVTEAGQNQRAKLQADTTLAAARTRGEGSKELTAKDRAAIADKAMDNVNATLKANVPLQIKASKDPAYLQQMVQAETARLMAAAGGTTMSAAPGAASPGGTSLKYNPKTGKIE